MLSSLVSTVNGAWIQGIEIDDAGPSNQKDHYNRLSLLPQKVGIVYTSDLLSTAVSILNCCHSETIDTGPDWIVASLEII
jgi:hypothetical protein